MGDSIDDVRRTLSGPGGFFEVVDEDVRGRPMRVFANRKRSLRELVDAAGAFDDRELLVLGDRRWTYAEFRSAVAAVAGSLRDEFGVLEGDRVAILAANRPEWVITFFAVAEVGAVVVALNGWWTAEEIRYGLELTEPKVLVADRRRLERLDDVPDGLSVIEIESGFSSLLAASAGTERVALDEDDPALILFTSGTTGLPKGALISHRALIGFVDALIYNGAERALASGTAAAPRGQVVTLATSPLFHVSGLFGSTLIGVAIGAKLVFREGRFDAEDMLAIIEREQVTSWSAIGSMGPRVLASPDLFRRDTTSVTNIGFGGAPTSPDLQRRLRQAFPNAATSFAIGYGSSESVAVCTSISGDDLLERPTSCGRPTLLFEIEIRADNGAALPVGATGRVHVRSPFTMLGYWRDPEATSSTIDAEGWLDMGDIGHLGDDGYLYLTARSGDTILRAAENIQPVEIEHRLDAHPHVSESAVFGVDHDELGQEVKAVVVAVPGSTLDRDELAAHCAATLAAFKVPSVWEIRSEPLPRNAAGKVVKNALTGERDLVVHDD